MTNCWQLTNIGLSVVEVRLFNSYGVIELSPGEVLDLCDMSDSQLEFYRSYEQLGTRLTPVEHCNECTETATEEVIIPVDIGDESVSSDIIDDELESLSEVVDTIDISTISELHNADDSSNESEEYLTETSSNDETEIDPESDD